MPAWHHHTPAGDWVSLVNIGVGPTNAKTVTDHLAVLRPDTMVIIGHCGGLRNHQRLGDFVVATAYQRADHVLDGVLPADVPVIPNHRLNTFLLDALDAAQTQYRLGVVHTPTTVTGSSTRAARSRRCGPRAAPRWTWSQRRSPATGSGPSKRQHLGIALTCLDRVRREHPGGLPSHDIRSVDEPLFEVD